MVGNLQLLIRTAAVGGLALALSACGSGSNSSTATTIVAPVVTATAQEDKFGTAFGTDYRAVANTEPATTADSDIVAVSLTTEPIEVN